MPIPSPSNTSSIAADTSGSSNGASRSSASATVTRTPSRANNCASSSPTAFPPITSIDSGSPVSSIAFVEVRYPACSRPLMGGYPRCRPGRHQVLPGLDRRGAVGAGGDVFMMEAGNETRRRV
jgi:hypothetical protein